MTVKVSRYFFLFIKKRVEKCTNINIKIILLYVTIGCAFCLYFIEKWIIDRKVWMSLGLDPDQIQTRVSVSIAGEKKNIRKGRFRYRFCIILT